GAALTGMRPVMIHQRIDFALLAMDQLVNNAAKWRYMFAGQAHVPLVVRVIIGRGWGQGPQHSQGLQALFAHIPGLKVMMPATAADAHDMLLAAIADDDPVLFIEHRWLHHVQGQVNVQQSVSAQGARTIRRGNGITIACFSHMLVEALKAADWLAKRGVEAEIIDMRWANPLDTDTVVTSVKSTGYLLVADSGWQKGGLAQSLTAAVLPHVFEQLKAAPAIVAMPDHPVPTTRALADHYYAGAEHIAAAVLDMLKIEYQQEQLDRELVRTEPRDQPDRDFTGPF
ncbi:MAG: transketolase C-terminal domain-containing protein, partial [Chromatiales bacterium]